MPQVQTINLMQPIAAASIIPEAQWGTVGGRVKAEGLGDGSTEFAGNHRQAALDDATPRSLPSDHLRKELQQQKDELDRLLETVNALVGRLHELHEETLACNRVEITGLAVEISRRILMYKVSKGDYEIQAIVEEALKQAPTRQNIVVRLNPEDLPRCQQLQREDPQSPFAELELAADWNIGRGECLVETPKGIVKSFVEQHLEHISEALQKVQ
jgi:flagellar biosynthesis/type III secretory pathway protein FliH